MNPGQLRRRAAKLRLSAAQALSEAQLLEETAARLDELTSGLTAHRQAVRVGPTVSAAATEKSASDPFLSALAEVGLSVRGLAKKLGVSAAFISQVRAGLRQMPADRAKDIERLTGWPAKNWLTIPRASSR